LTAEILPEPRWVSRIVAEAIHFDLIRAHGGMQGIRDMDLLEGALARARQRFAYEPESDLCDLAAAYGFGIARSHPFHDGNKRLAFVVMAVFLRLNGLDLDAPETQVVTTMLDLAAGASSEEELAEWLRSRIKSR
jgi:death on curing protein